MNSEAKYEEKLAWILIFPLQEKRQLIEDLQSDLAHQSDSDSIPQWHLEELQRREANFNPKECLTWQDVQEKILDRYGCNNHFPTPRNFSSDVVYNTVPT